MDFRSPIDLWQNELQNAVIQKLPSAPSNPAEGQVYYNTTEKLTYQWDGTEWMSFGGALENYGVCSTSVNTNVKTVTIPSVTSLYAGLQVTVRFTFRNGSAQPKLNVSGLGAKDLLIYDQKPFGTDDDIDGWRAGSIYTFVYNGTAFVMAGRPNTDTDTKYTNLSLMHAYGTCNTAEETSDKSVLPKYGNIQLVVGGYLTVRFSNAVKANSTMYVSNGGSKPIYYRGSAITDGVINAGDTALFTYTTDIVASGVWVLVAICEKEMTGATSSKDGISGMVPAPATSDRNKFLCGDGTWKEGPKTLIIFFENVYDREHHIDYWVPKKTESTYYTINELTQLLQEGYMIIARAGTSSAAGNYYYPDVRWNGQTSNQLLFRKTGVEFGAFESKLLELYSSDYPDYGEVWKINTEFSINI